MFSLLYKIQQRHFKNLKETITVRVPENSLMKYIMKGDKGEIHAGSHELFEKELGYFKGNDFWNRDKGYRLPEEHLLPLIDEKKKLSLIDVGCHVGALPFFIKGKQRWNRVAYTGTDVIPLPLSIAKREHPEGNFFGADAQTYVTDDVFDVVYTKGTIISTSAPDRALENILNIPGEYYYLLHQPLYTSGSQANFEHILVVKQEEMYTSTIMSYDYLMETVERHNLTVVKAIKRPECKVILNFGDYYIYDFILKKNA